MKISGFRGLRGSVELKDLTQVVLYDDLGQPLLIANSPANGVVVVMQVGDESFEKMLRELKLTEPVPRVKNA